MAHAHKDEIEKLTRAFSGLGGFGVEEKELIATISQWRQQPEKKVHFRRGNSGLFRSESANFERLEDDHVKRLKTEFSRFKNVVLLWAMHPWERDARWSHHVLHKAHPSAILIEIACTRSSEELLGARKAYHALFHHSLEEDVAYYVKEPNAKLLVGLVSSYRYEGPYVNDERAKLEAKMLNNAIKKVLPAGKPVEHDDLVRILSTRSKLQLKLTFKHYRELFGKSIEDDLAADEGLQETVLCLSSPPTYFSKMINKAINEGADRNIKDALTRVMVSRSEVDMKEIKEIYAQKYGAKLEEVIAKNTYGNYRDALLSLVDGKDIKI